MLSCLSFFLGGDPRLVLAVALLGRPRALRVVGVPPGIAEMRACAREGRKTQKIDNVHLPRIW
jgi:hypothetical protein